VVVLIGIISLNHRWTSEMREFRMSRIPVLLGASSISYRSEEICGAGFMPGDDEAGVTVYPLPASVLDAISQQGLSFFDGIDPDWPEWKPTPLIKDDSRWPEAKSPFLGFIHLHSCGLEIVPSVVEAIDEAIATPGNYYAFKKNRREGVVLVVVPSRGEAFFFFAG